jgi:hypothetical protein
LIKIGKDYFDNSFHFKQVYNSFIAKSNNMSNAINNKKNDSQKVNVIKWSDNLWIYIEIKYVPKIDKEKSIPNIIFTLSAFHGEMSDEKKLQLFRAVWDNYDGPNDKHPQPHWHIYSQIEEESEENFEEQLSKEKNPFNKYLESNSNKIINTDRFHFAMNGQWSENKSDVHSISKESDLINWFRGLLNHLKKELEYVKMK